jgi:hypothetical protein
MASLGAKFEPGTFQIQSTVIKRSTAMFCLSSYDLITLLLLKIGDIRSWGATGSLEAYILSYSFQIILYGLRKHLYNLWNTEDSLPDNIVCVMVWLVIIWELTTLISFCNW